MVEFSIKVHREQQLAYLPNAIVKLLGYDLTLIPNSKCAVLFSKGTAISFVLKSLDVITREIELMHQMEEMVQATDEKKGECCNAAIAEFGQKEKRVIHHDSLYRKK